jgi:hypothetical protein
MTCELERMLGTRLEASGGASHRQLIQKASRARDLADTRLREMVRLSSRMLQRSGSAA